MQNGALTKENIKFYIVIYDKLIDKQVNFFDYLQKFLYDRIFLDILIVISQKEIIKKNTDFVENFWKLNTDNLYLNFKKK